MIFNLFTAILLLTTPNHSPGDSLTKFRYKLGRDICLYIEPPPGYDSGDTCFHYSELLKVEINKTSKVTSIEFSDNAPEWLKKELIKQKQRKWINYKKLDSLAFESRLRNCVLIFPFIIESDYFPCGQVKKEQFLNSNFFQFDGKYLNGNIIFGEEIRHTILIGSIIKDDKTKSPSPYREKNN